MMNRAILAKCKGYLLMNHEARWPTWAVISLLVVGRFGGTALAQAGANARSTQPFELHVVGPDGNPVPAVAVEIRLDPPLLTANQVRRGKLTQIGGHTVVQADDEGRVALKLPVNPKYFVLAIKHPNHGPYWAVWRTSDHPEVVPPQLTAELDAGWTVGGVVVDSDGNPVEGAKVRPSVKFKKRPGDDDELWLGDEFVTDADGKWKFQSVPASMNDVRVTVSHADFKPERRQLTRSVYGLEPGQESTAKIPLTRGIMVIGRVTDEAGHPVPDALVRTKFTNELRETTTGRDGTYFLSGSEPRMTRIVVSAKGRAMELQNVRVEPNMPSVDFVLQPGGHVRVRVLDEDGNPLPRTRIFFQRWRGHIDYFEFDHVNEYTDGNGVWEWNEAPLDEFRADICRPGGMQLLEQPLVARQEEYVFRPPPALVISGRIVDAATQEPIKKFRVVPGQRWDDTRLYWSEREGYDGIDGRYSIKRNRGHIAHLVRVEADGYRRAVSRDIKSDEGNVTIDFELEPANNISAKVLTSDGSPAAGAKVALGVDGSQIQIENGSIDDGSTYARRLLADAAGLISFPPPDDEYQLVITHPTGFAHVQSAQRQIPERIQLTPWARVEGVFHVGLQPAAGVTLNINSNAIQSYGQGQPHIFTTHRATTGTDGSFVFEHVLPGKARLGRRILLMVDDGATEVTSSKMVPIDLAAGETTRVDLGGDGRAVIGQLAPPADHQGKVLWNFAIIHANAHLPQLESPPVPADVRSDNEKYRDWWKKWIETDDGKAWAKASQENQSLRERAPYFTASVARDGTFRIDDMNAGNYRMSVRFNEHPAGQLLNYDFSVAAADDSDASQPVVLGVLTLEKVSQR